MFVLTADQRDSRGDVDRVHAVLVLLQRAVPAPVRAFERTAGDEVQGVLGSAEDVLRAVVALAADGSWSVGVGVGHVEQPLPPSTRAGRGPAFSAARVAVESAKQRPHHAALVAGDDRQGPGPELVADADAVLALALTVAARWSDEAREAVELVGGGLTQTEAAARLGISRQAVGQRLTAAMWRPQADCLAVVSNLLRRADRILSDDPGEPHP